MGHWSKTLTDLDACKEAVVWALTQPDEATAWQACQRGDWMLWLLGKQVAGPNSASRKTLVLCACACARTALPYVRKGEERPLRAIETAERWARGEANAPSLEEVKKAAYAAAAAASAAYAAAAASLAARRIDAAATASAYAASASAYAAAAASAADSAAYAAAYAAYARTKALAACADIVREHYPVAPAQKQRRAA